MTVITNFHLPKEAFLLACTICEQGEPSIAGSFFNMYKSEMEKLVELKAFIIGTNYWLEDENRDYVDVVYQNEKPGYFNKNKKFIEVPFEKIHSYKLNLNWMAKTVSKSLAQQEGFNVEILVDNFLWQVALIKETPIFFARRIYRETVLNQVVEAIKKRQNKNKAIILTSASAIPSYINNENNPYKIILLADCINFNNKNFAIDLNILKSNEDAKNAIRKEGFSNGYRSAFFSDQEFKFTKKEAEVLEYLVKAGKPVHKDEIMAEISGARNFNNKNSKDFEDDLTSSSEIKYFFRGKNSKGIKGLVLKYDNNGFYWIDRKNH